MRSPSAKRIQSIVNAAISEGLKVSHIAQHLDGKIEIFFGDLKDEKTEARAKSSTGWDIPARL